MSSTTGTDPVRNSVRFPLHLEVVLSTPEREYVATTADVSANGVLLVGTDLPPADTSVTFRVTMPAQELGGQGNVVLHCTGRIVRRTEQEGGQFTAAAVIDEYSLKAESL